MTSKWRSPLKLVILKEHMRKSQMNNVSRHEANTTWTKYLQQFSINIKIDC